MLSDLFIDRLKSDSPILSQKGGYNPLRPTLDQYHLQGISSNRRRIAKVAKNFGTANNVELPVRNTSYDRKEHRYVYGIHSKGESSFVEYVIKVDIATGETKKFGIDRCTPGEPIFIPRPGGTAEDDGVLLVVCLDGVRGRSLLAVVDAQTMQLVARAGMEEGKVVPF